MIFSSNYKSTFKQSLLLIFFSLLLIPNVRAQNDIDNHSKYWYFKSRLNNDFLKVGLDSGESIPAQTRGKNNSTQKFSLDANSVLAWGDATSYLGYYIAILATEYKLLAVNNQSTSKVKHELFCALNAVNRLDYIAETFFADQTGNDYPAVPNLNGYFVRDDVPKYFVQSNYQHFNYYDSTGHPVTNNTVARGFMSDFESGANRTEGSIESWSTFTATYGFDVVQEDDVPIPEESQDQAIALLYGMAFVQKFVPDWETDGSNVFGYGSGETSLATEARNISDRIIKHIRDSKDQAGNSCNPMPGEMPPLALIPMPWQIRNPVNCRPVGYNKEVDIGFGIGDDAEQFSYALAEIGHVIKQKDFGGIPGNISLTNNYPTKGALLYFNTDYHDLFSSSIGDNLWHELNQVPLPGNGDNRLHMSNLAAVCNCVYNRFEDEFAQVVEEVFERIPILSFLGEVIGWIIRRVGTIIRQVLNLPGYFLNNTATAMTLNSYFLTSDFDHAPLSRKILHGGLWIQNPQANFKDVVDAAPCDNIYFLPFETLQYSTAQWSSEDRIEHPNQRVDPLGNKPHVHFGEYTGLDYLLYHNLWYIHEMQEGAGSSVYDQSDIYINKNGANAYAAGVYKAFETITTENTIFDTESNLDYMRAGKYIYFGPGTEIRTDATDGGMHAYIKRNTCATETGSFRPGRTDEGGQPDLQPNFVNYPVEVPATQTIIPATQASLIQELPLTSAQQFENELKKAYPEFSKEFFVKPTITSDHVYAYFHLKDGEQAYMNMINMMGQTVYSSTKVNPERNGMEIDLSQLPAGTYILKFTSTGGTTKTQKIIKQ